MHNSSTYNERRYCSKQIYWAFAKRILWMICIFSNVHMCTSQALMIKSTSFNCCNCLVDLINRKEPWNSHLTFYGTYIWYLNMLIINLNIYQKTISNNNFCVLQTRPNTIKSSKRASFVVSITNLKVVSKGFLTLKTFGKLLELPSNVDEPKLFSWFNE